MAIRAFLKKYNFTQFLNNGLSLVYTKCFWRGARLVRFPIFVSGKNYIHYGKGLTIGRYGRIDIVVDETAKKKLIIGENCTFGDMLQISVHENINIGNHLLAASRIFITDGNHGDYSSQNPSVPTEIPQNRILSSIPVKIGNNVWIGENVSILAGTTIGNGCVIGANTVVKGKFPDNCIICGNPGRIVKVFNETSKQWEKYHHE